MVAQLEKPAGMESDELSPALLKLMIHHGPSVRTFLALAFANGLSIEQVAKLFRQPANMMEDFRTDGVVVELITEIQVAMGYSPEKRLALAMQSAVDVKMQLLTRGNDKLKDKIATDIIERNLGKPVQTTQSLNMNINATSDMKEIDTRLTQVTDRLRVIEEKRQKLLGTRS